MQLTNSPAKIPLPFAASGLKNTIPEASQIGITAGAASLTDGFPPLTRTPLASGGIPVAPGDMNGILFALSAVIRWANAGGGYAFDNTFATDSNVGGYPKGARVMRSDGLGYWFNTAENNVTDPESVGAVAAGWVMDFTTGATVIAMTGSNVTLTALQYGKPIIIITGLLTANLNLIFPVVVGQWTVINNTTGAFTITAKTAAGTGVVVGQGTASLVYGDGANVGQIVTVVTSTNDTAFADNSTKQASTSWLKFGFAISLGISGYLKFPSWLGGLTINWGVGTTNASGDLTVTLPLAFSISQYIAVSTAFGNAANVVVSIASMTTSTMTLRTVNPASGTGTPQQCSYIAIGK